MRAILFRKQEVDGVNYYQLFNEIDNFEPDEDVTDFLHRGEKEYFYINGDSDIEIPDSSLLNIYYDSNEGFTNVVDSNLFLKVFNVFKEKYNIVIKEIKPIDEVVNNVSKKIMFQDDVISRIVQRIYLNQRFVISDLPIELKQRHKFNILFHGPSGSGKKTIIKCLQKELNLPYVEITINSNIRDTVETIITTLLERSNTPEEASCGIVYIKDNFEELDSSLGNNGSVYNMINYLTSQEVITYEGKEIDFRTLTFVVLFNDDEHEMSFDEVQALINCDFDLTTRELSDGEKYEILLSENGIIKHYEKFFNDCHQKFLVDEESLMNLIEKCNEINSNLDVINQLISAIVNYCTYNGITDVSIDKDNVEMFNKMIDYSLSNNNEKKKSKEIIENFLFEKKVDKVFNEARKYVIGQDKNLRLLITEIISNLDVGADNTLVSPESYKHNILVRGNTGSGKTFMIKTVLRILGVPFAEGDSTKYTETGYVGSSIDSVFTDLIHAAGGNIELAQRGIVFLDEIDKKANNRPETSASTKESVLHELLKPAEGNIIQLNIGETNNPQYVDFDTSRVTFICSGAFTGIEKIRDKRIKKDQIGFQNEKKEKIDYNLHPELDPNIIADDYIKYGMPDEFMGRVKTLIDLNDVTKEMLIDIMKYGELNPLKIQKYLFASREIDLEYTEEFCDELANVAIARKQGVRGLDNALEVVLQRINYQDIRASEVEKIILDKDVIYNPSKVILIERANQKQKKLEI